MASTTDNQEAAQAYFCAIVDFLGATNAKKLVPIETYTGFLAFWAQHQQSGKSSLKDLFETHVKSGRSSYAEVEKALDNNAWYRSSRNIALKLIDEVQKNKNLSPFRNIANVGWQDIFYAHQDTGVMEQVSELFKLVSTNHKNNIAKKWAAPFSDINKWSPADIYFATDRGVEQLSEARATAVKKVWSYAELNTFVYRLWKAGDLLPVSLKKAGDTVTVKYVNLEKSWEARLKNYEPQAIEVKAGLPAFMKVVKSESTSDRRVRILFTVGDTARVRYSLEFATKCSYPVRKAATSAGMSGLETKIKIELIPLGGNAKEGQVGPEAIYQIPGLSAELKAIFKKADTERKQFKELRSVQKLITERTRQVQRSLYRGNQNPPSSMKVKYSVTNDGKVAKVLTDDGKKETIEFQKRLAVESNQSFEGTLLDGLKAHFKTPKSFNDIRLLFMYTAARSENAAAYIIAK